ncbi:MAG: hypothetical protein QG599_431 [Pseudomonadota bacterium]|nr:hypothetical protein [Pseudomonadota bacterium]
MKTLLKSAIALMVAGGMLFTSVSYATAYIVWDTTIHIYAQGRADSQAHLMGVDNPMYNGGSHPWCGNRAYIEFGDKEMFAIALAASMSGQKVNVYYEDAAPSKLVAGHTETTCKIFSIWR